MTAGSTGYVFGGFDLFNIGHVDFLRQGAERCDRLVVGVATDDLMESCGGRPFVPQTERLEIVSALRWLDHVHLLDGLDLWAEVGAVGADTVFLPGAFPDAVQRACGAPLQLAGSGARLVVLRVDRRTASVAVRAALEGTGERSSVA